MTTENYIVTFMPKSTMLGIETYKNADKPSVEDYDGKFTATRLGAIIAEGFCKTFLNSVDILQVDLYEAYGVDKIVIQDRATNEKFLILE